MRLWKGKMNSKHGLQQSTPTPGHQVAPETMPTHFRWVPSPLKEKTEQNKQTNKQTTHSPGNQASTSEAILTHSGQWNPRLVLSWKKPRRNGSEGCCPSGKHLVPVQKAGNKPSFPIKREATARRACAQRLNTQWQLHLRRNQRPQDTAFAKRWGVAHPTRTRSPSSAAVKLWQARFFFF